MRYKDDLNIIVEKALKEETVNEKIISEIKKVVSSIFSSSLMPFFNGLTFISVANDKLGPLRVLFASSINGVSSVIELKYEDDIITVKDNNYTFELIFSKNYDQFKFLYDGTNVIIFNGRKDTTDSDLKKYLENNGGYSKIRISVYTNVTSVDVDEYCGDCFCNYDVSRYTHDSNYYFTEKKYPWIDKNGKLKVSQLGDFFFTMIFAISGYENLKEKMIDKLAPMGKNHNR